MVSPLLRAGHLAVWALCAGLACAQVCAQAGAQGTGGASLQRERVEGLSGEVFQVVPCGAWQDGKAFGDRRLVLMRGQGGAGTEVYLQWLAAPEPATGRVRPVRTVGVDELNNDHAQFDFAQATCAPGRGQALVALRGSFEHDERPRTRVFRLTVRDNGQYVLHRR